jgi:3-hydroxybutyryl-CoA dehydratase
MPGPERFYFEDVVVHGTLETPALTVTEAHVAMYAGIAQEPVDDPHDVPALLPLCLATGLGWRSPQPPLAVLAFLSIEWETVAPLRVGDTIHSRSRTALKRSMREGGVVVEERELVNQRGQVVQKGRFTFLVAKRPTG